MPRASGAPYDVPPPAAFAASLAGRPAEGGPDGDAWLRTLPSLVGAALERWELTPDGTPRHGHCALVLPVRRRGEALALKVQWPHPEARHEHLALRAWAGDGAVRLIAAHPGDGALLLERLAPDRPLTRLDIPDACRVLGGLIARLDVPALPRLDRLSDWTTRFLERTADVPAVAAAGVPRRFMEQARSMARDLAAQPGLDGRLVHTDLHDGNVLAALEARPGSEDGWLAIDPKPLAAQPAFAVAPILWNRWPEALADGDTTWHLKCRLGWVCEAAGIDEDRARAWSLVRLVATATWRAGRGQPAERTKHTGGGANAGSASGPAMTALIAAMKAVAGGR